MSEAITLVKTVGDAQRRYFLQNGTYTTNFNDLDITMPPGEIGSIITSSGTSSIFTADRVVLQLRLAEPGMDPIDHFFIAAAFAQDYGVVNTSIRYFPHINKAYCNFYSNESTAQREERFCAFFGTKVACPSYLTASIPAGSARPGVCFEMF